MDSLEDASRLAAEFERIRSQTAKAAPGITPTQASVLMTLLHSGPVTHAALVAALGRDKAQVSKAVSALVEKGLVESTPGLHHKRQRDLSLSDSGRHLAESMQGGGTASGLAGFVDRIGPNGRSLLHDLARLLSPDTRRDPAESRLAIRTANLADLRWLLVQPDGLPLTWGEFDGLLECMQDLIDHINLAQKFNHRWVLEQSGQRIGGAVLTPDRQAMENAWIKLLRVNNGSKDAYAQLIRRCVSAAEAQTYELVQIEIRQSAEALREVLSGIGFRPLRSRVQRGPGGELKMMTWGLQLLPPIDPDRVL